MQTNKLVAIKVISKSLIKVETSSLQLPASFLLTTFFFNSLREGKSEGCNWNYKQWKTWTIPTSSSSSISKKLWCSSLWSSNTAVEATCWNTFKPRREFPRCDCLLSFSLHQLPGGHTNDRATGRSPGLVPSTCVRHRNRSQPRIYPSWY